MTFHDLTCVLEALQEAKCPILVYDGLTATGKKAVFVAVFFLGGWVFWEGFHRWHNMLVYGSVVIYPSKNDIKK